jgi:hypothetical protein
LVSCRFSVTPTAAERNTAKVGGDVKVFAMDLGWRPFLL